MQKATNVKLKGLDELFALSDPNTDSNQENIQHIPIVELHPFQNHPFKVADDAAMQSMAESIKEYGVLMPVIARPLESDGMSWFRDIGVGEDASWRA